MVMFRNRSPRRQSARGLNIRRARSISSSLVLSTRRPRASFDRDAGSLQLKGRHDASLSLKACDDESGALALFSGARGAKTGFSGAAREQVLPRTIRMQSDALRRRVAREGPSASPRRSSFERLCRSQIGPQRGRATVGTRTPAAGELVHRPFRCGAARAQRTL